MSAESEILALRARVADLEARMNFLYRHLSVEYVEDADLRHARVIEMLKKGNLIEAIKIYREIHNVGLAEAKKGVESIQARLGM